jgi:hypothetical protein
LLSLALHSRTNYYSQQVEASQGTTLILMLTEYNEEFFAERPLEAVREVRQHVSACM